MIMKKKNKLIILIILLILLILICRSIFSFKDINYTLNIDGNNIEIRESYNINNYYIEMKTKNNVYPFRIYIQSNDRKLIKSVYIFEDKNIECILPLIDNKIYTDIMCYKDNTLYDYHNLIGQNEKLDEYVSNIQEYDINLYKNEFDQIKIIGTTKYNRLTNFNKFISITTYKGLITDGKEINLFNKDIYNNKISTFIDKYYIVADYNNTYSFNYFYIVDITNGEIKKIKSKEDISYDSYIQGIVDNKIYLYDKDNENQYEIDIINNKINIVSNNNYIKYYSNKKWEKMNKVKANKEIYFDFNTLDNNFTSYDYVKEVENYYYLFKKDGISYKLYRVDKNNIDIYKFILDVPVTNIFFNDDYLYYTYKNKLFYYSDQTGIKTLLENSELEFNDTIKYYIY